MNLLLLEDNATDAVLIKKTLERAGLQFDADVVSNEDSFTSALKNRHYDTILSDNALPQFNATDALKIIKNLGVYTPCIIVSGSVSDETACNLLQEGASDYVLKDRLHRLPYSVRNAVNNYHLQTEYYKRTTDILKREELIREAEQLAHVGSWESDVLNNKQFWSDENYRMLGYQPAEVAPCKDSLLARIHPDDRDYAERSMEHAKQHLNHLKYAFRVIPGDNMAVTHIESEVFIMRDDKRKITRINGFLKDVTDKKNIEDRIAKSEQKYRHLFDNNPVPMWVIDAETFIFYDVNNAAIRHYGYTYKEFLSMTATEIRPKEEQQRFLDIDRVDHRYGNIGFWKHRKKNGTIITVEVTTDNIVYDGKKCILVLANDITEKKEAENKLKHSAKRLKQAQAIAHIGSWDLDFATGVSIWSEEECAIHGLSPSDNVQSFEAWQSFIHPADLGYVMTILNHAKATSTGTSYSYRIILQDGSIRHIYSQFEFEINEAREATGLYGITHDVTDSKNAEINLRHTSERLKQAQAIAHVGSWELDLIGGDLLMSDETCRILGVPVEENTLTFEAWKSLLHPDDSEAALAVIEALTPSSSDTEVYCRIVRKDGNIRHVHAKFGLETDDLGVVTGLHGTIHHITEAREAEDKLRHTSERLKQAQKVAHVGSWELNFGTGIAVWSDEACKIYGLSPEENIQSYESWLSFIHPDDLDHVLKKSKESEATLRNAAFTHRIIKRDGSIRYLFSQSEFDINDAGVPVGMYGVAHDITETKEAEQAHMRSEANLRLIMDLLPQSISVRDGDGNFIFVNNSFAKMYGIPAESLIGQSVASTIPDHNIAEEFIKRDREIIRSGKTRVIPEIAFTTSDGSTRTFNVTKVPYALAGKSEPAILGIAYDITDQKKAEAERIKFTEDIFRRNSDLEEFSYIVSHSLRAPVANILGLANIMDLEGISDAEKQYIVRGVTASVKKLDEVISDLNQVTQVSHAAKERRQLISFSTLTNHIINDHTNPNDIDFITDFSEVDSFDTVSSYMHSIFYNLITNSLKLRQPGAPLTIEIKSRKNNGNVQLTFKDNGPGMDLAKTGSQVFDLFKKFHKGASEDKGIGLFMVKSHVETLGGKIKVHSELNRGTEFMIEFPLPAMSPASP